MLEADKGTKKAFLWSRPLVEAAPPKRRLELRLLRAVEVHGANVVMWDTVYGVAYMEIWTHVSRHARSLAGPPL